MHGEIDPTRLTRRRDHARGLCIVDDDLRGEDTSDGDLETLLESRAQEGELLSPISEPLRGLDARDVEQGSALEESHSSGALAWRLNEDIG